MDNPYLNQVPNENFFKLANGISFGSLESLYEALKNSDSQIFYNHVTNDRNDFANWITACIKYPELAHKLSDIKEREVFLGVLAEEIAILKTPKIAQTMEFFKETPDTTAPPAIASGTPSSAPVIPVSSPPNTPPSAPTNYPPTNAPTIPPEAAVQQPNPQPTQPSSEPDIRYEFEDVLKPVIDDIDKEIDDLGP